MPFERSADFRACAMEEYPLIGLRKLEDVTHLFRRPALDVAEADHQPLRRRQLLDRRCDHATHLRRLEFLPRLGEPRPATRELRVPEPGRIDRRLVLRRFALEAREGKAARLALGARLRGVRDDAEDPGLQRGAALETREAAQHAQPRVL